MIPVRPVHLFFALCPILLICLGVSAPARSETAEETGLKIAQDSQDREKGFGNFMAQQTMVLRNKHGQESRRQLRVKVLEVPEDGDKSLFVFDEPRDVKGNGVAYSRA